MTPSLEPAAAVAGRLLSPVVPFNSSVKFITADCYPAYQYHYHHHHHHYHHYANRLAPASHHLLLSRLTALAELLLSPASQCQTQAGKASGPRSCRLSTQDATVV